MAIVLRITSRDGREVSISLHSNLDVPEVLRLCDALGFAVQRWVGVGDAK